MSPPLARPQTSQSTHSWWSDRNPVGPTISIHAAAKPLMRLMYHEQVRSFIKRNLGTPLDRETMETCVSYLAYKYISPATKTLIMRELSLRVKVKEEARVMENAFMVQGNLIENLLASSDARIRRDTCTVMGTLASSSESTPWYLDVCAQIVSLLSDKDAEVRESAIYAVVKISESPGGAEAVVATKIWEYFPERLASLNSIVYQFTYGMLSNLAVYQVASLRMTGSSDTEPRIRRHAIYVLSQISHWSEGAEATAEARALESVADLLNSYDPETRRWTCEMLVNMTFHRPSSVVQLGVKDFLEIVSLLRDDDNDVRDGAVLTLSNLTHSPSSIHWWGPTQVLDEQVLRRLSDLLHSGDTETLKWACNILGNLVVHHSTSVLALGVRLCERIEPLLSNGDSGVRERALYAAAMISHSPDGAELVRGTKIWEYFSLLLDSVYPQAHRFTCQILGNLAIHSSTSLSVGSRIYEQIVALLRANEVEVRRNAMYALSKLSYRPDMAQLVRTLQHVPNLLHSSDHETQKWTCELLGNLAVHTSPFVFLHDIGLCTRIVSLLGNADRGVRECALYAIARISHSPDGAEVVRGTDIWKYFVQLLNSRYPQTHRFTCQILGNLTVDTACLGFFGLGSYLRIVSMLRDNDVKLQRHAMYVLSKFSQWPEAAKFVTAAGTMEYVVDLLHSPDHETWRWTCEMLANLLTHGYTSVSLGAGPCARIVGFLSDKNEYVRYSAILPLSKISRSSEGASAVGNTEILEHVPRLMDFHSSRSLTLETLGNLGFFQVLPSLGGALRARIKYFLSHKDSDIRESTMFALMS